MYEENEETVLHVFQDPVHGSIEMDTLCMKIINTPQFQRLRFIKQLGATSFVYPGAVHTRFEHSIGTCYLASTMVKMLMQKQRELMIDEDDLKCVSIAALCHDLGHGPFSHLFDRSFLPSYHPDWKHEHASISMLQHLIQHNNLGSFFTANDLLFIRELILPTTELKARGPDKRFLYEIVSNRDTGIDVDKWDYFSRDCLYLGLKSSFDSQRLMKFVRVKRVGGVRQICYRDKVCDNIAEMFTNRKRLFRTAYFHKTTLIIDHMISKVFEKANDHLKFKGEGGKYYKLSECVSDMEAYSRLTDDLLMHIYNSDDPSLHQSKALIDRLFRRQLPKFVGKVDAACVDKDENGLKEVMMMAGGSDLNAGDVIVLKRTLDLGMNDLNPLHQCLFFSKNSSDPAFKIRPQHTEEVKKTHYLIYCNNTQRQSLVAGLYEELCALYKLPCSKGIETAGIELTPDKRSHQMPATESELTKKIKLQL